MREPKKQVAEIRGYGWAIPLFECESCGDRMQEWFEDGDLCICPECAFKKGVCTDKEYLEAHSIYFDTARATIHEGEIYVVFHGKFPFEKTNRDHRKTNEYKEWRSKVFERDGYKCQICGQVGGTLNAHHIKPFSEYPKLRYELSNGITLCEQCHKDVHRRMRNNGHKKGSGHGSVDR